MDTLQIQEITDELCMSLRGSGEALAALLSGCSVMWGYSCGSHACSLVNTHTTMTDL